MIEARAWALALLLVLIAASHATAGDVRHGAGLVEKCQVCHGIDGIAKIVEAPNLAGQNEAYLIKQLSAFKTGERQNEMMSVVAPTLSDQDIEDLASYYAAIEITVKTPGDTSPPPATPAVTPVPVTPAPSVAQAVPNASDPLPITPRPPVVQVPVRRGTERLRHARCHHHRQ